MKPTTKIYTIKFGKGMSNEFYLGMYTNSREAVLRPCSFGAEMDGKIQFPWMTKNQLVAWFRKAADVLEGTELE